MLNKTILTKVARVCLILDNPLRDIDGIILLASELAINNVEVFVVPMYDQSFDVVALMPDLIVSNCARSDNYEQLSRYKMMGIKVAILDTEGTPSVGPDEFSLKVKKLNYEKIIDLYCFWGVDQYEAFKRNSVLPKNTLALTGCPRFDFCSHNLKKTLPETKIQKDFILINTRFPSINPRFTTGIDEERQGIIDAGYTAEWADLYLTDCQNSYEKFIEVIEKLAIKFTNQIFVIRPHTFENSKGYDSLLKFDNIHVQQEGTSIEWTNAATLLIHQNCTTSVEAVLLNKEVISLEWFNTKIMKGEGSPSSISFQPKNQKDLEKLLSDIISNKPLNTNNKLFKIRNDLIKAQYLSNDGNSTKRVTEAIINVLSSKSIPKFSLLPHFSTRSKLLFSLKKILGYKLYHFLKRVVQGSKHDMRIKAKLFNLKHVNSIISRIDLAVPGQRNVNICYASKNDMSNKRLSSGNVIKISLK